MESQWKMHTKVSGSGLNNCITFSACDGRAKYRNLLTGGQLINKNESPDYPKHKSVPYLVQSATSHCLHGGMQPPARGHFVPFDCIQFHAMYYAYYYGCVMHHVLAAIHLDDMVLSMNQHPNWTLNSWYVKQVALANFPSG